MDTFTLESQTSNGGCIEEEICLRAFHAAETLKNKIRQTISDYQQRGWELICIFIQGPSVHLKFKPKHEVNDKRRDSGHVYDIDR